MFMRGLKRLEIENGTSTVTRAKPITPEIVCKLIALLDDDSGLVTWRTVWRIVIGYYMLYRWDDISRLRMSDITMEYENFTRIYRIKLRGGKTGNAQWNVKITYS